MNGHIMTCKKVLVPSLGEEEILILDMQGNRGNKLGHKWEPETEHHTNKMMSTHMSLKYINRGFSADLNLSQ